MDSKRYIIVFFITLGIFSAAFWVSNFFSDQKIQQIKSIQDQISIDILSSETQFSLLQELSCKDVSNTALSKELGTLADKIEYSEKNIGNSEEISDLKKFYSLLQIKDYLLMKKITERCKMDSVFVLYFYTTESNCAECTKQGYVLTALREKYPEFRVYSFDYNIDLSAVKTLISIYDVEDTKLPAMVINGKLVTGFKNVEEVEKMLPALKDLLPEEEEEEDSTLPTQIPVKK